MRYGTWPLAIFFVWCLLFPAGTAECTLTYITVEAIGTIDLASIAMGVPFFLDHRISNDWLLRSTLIERFTAAFSDITNRHMETALPRL